MKYFWNTGNKKYVVEVNNHYNSVVKISLYVCNKNSIFNNFRLNLKVGYFILAASERDVTWYKIKTVEPSVYYTQNTYNCPGKIIDVYNKMH